jgi:hypothetical protein
MRGEQRVDIVEHESQQAPDNRLGTRTKVLGALYAER